MNKKRQTAIKKWDESLKNSHSFALVEDTLRESEFFLNQLRNSHHLSFESKCYFSAFVSASRNVTFAMQKSLSKVDGFDSWYKTATEKLKADALAPFFVEIRDAVKIGIRAIP